MARDEAKTADERIEPITAFRRIKAILGGSAGNLVEWYDWFAYSSTSLYFAAHFFPKGEQTAQQLQTAAIFAAGFVARPAGAWLMGIYADRAGRRAALTLSVALMSLGSFAIAILPTYAQIGVLAQLGLLAARLVQGLSLGGEYGASATYMSEMAGSKHRGFWSSFQYTTLIGGQLTALVVLVVLQHVLSKAALEAWGWRIPFAIGGVLAIVVFWIRTGLDETRAYLRAAAETARRGQTMTLFREHPREFAIVLVLTAAGSLAFYAYTTYMQKFLVNTAGFSKDTGTAIMAGVLVLYMLIQPAVGWLSDQVGRKTTMAVGLAAGAVATYPVMTAIAHSTSALEAFGLVMILVLCHAGYSAVNAAVKAELFPAHVRALGVALPYALANALFGGTAEYIAEWLKQAKMESGFYVYVAIVMLVGAVAAARLRNTNVTSLIADD
ncbi:MAG: major facilitator family transporter [Phenylobacterium sp.]|jgi:MHS family alpha-ketoglutarate permease-like MFS transporter|uniref:MFS transporter n=1 Tax=Phenylobacterium sp. TaxID=1871053 RepID=UPI00261C3117|nr:MFS transporter [Phenylobacterium sp.]MDB5496041.1 major facilitator family transporter [Phenylobacterium sp.]